jgi:hypothetical protein
MSYGKTGHGGNQEDYHFAVWGLQANQQNKFRFFENVIINLDPPDATAGGLAPGSSTSTPAGPRLPAVVASGEGELHRGLYRLAAYFQHGIGQEIDRAGSGTRFNYQVAATAEFDAIGRMVAKIVIPFAVCRFP